jgi:hypothetical protein
LPNPGDPIGSPFFYETNPLALRASFASGFAFGMLLCPYTDAVPSTDSPSPLN